MELNFKRALVTGAAGFIGSHIAHALMDHNIHICVIDNLRTGRNNLDMNRFNSIQHKVGNYGVSKNYFYQENIEDDIEHIFQFFRPEVVFHLAAIPGVSYSVEHPLETNKVNVEGTLNLLELSAKYKTERFVFSSSSSIYGGSENLPTKEVEPPNPKSPYALQKLIGEEYCKLYSKTKGLDTASLRYFNVFGERQYGGPYGAVISSFCKAKKDDEAPIIYGDGSQFRDFCSVDNIVSANLLAANYPDTLDGEVFNVGCGGKITVKSLIEYIGTKQPLYQDPRPGDVKCSQADISKAEKVLGYKVLTSFEEGIKKTIDWYMKI